MYNTVFTEAEIEFYETTEKAFVTAGDVSNLLKYWKAKKATFLKRTHIKHMTEDDALPVSKNEKKTTAPKASASGVWPFPTKY